MDFLNSRMKFLLFQFLNVQWGGPSHHFRLQRGCFLPVVQDCVEIANGEIYARLKKLGHRVVAVGDCQYESPGSCSKTGTYTIIASHLEYETTREVKDDDDDEIMLKIVDKHSLPSG